VLDRLPEVVVSSGVDEEMLGHVLDAVGQMQPGPTDEERSALSRLAHALGVPPILRSLSGPDDRRLGAVRLLSDDRSPSVLRALASQGSDPLEEIRGAAAAAITELAHEHLEAGIPSEPAERSVDGPQEEAERIASLARALQDGDATVRHLALSGLAGMNRGAIVAWVHDTIRGGDASQRALAASTAQVLRLVEGAADILDAAAELPADARHLLIEALTSFVMPPHQLVGLLSQVREAVRAEAIRMLWRVGGAPLLPHLRGYLDDPSDEARAAVLEAYGDSGEEASSEVALSVLEQDLSPEVRARAVRVLAKANGAPPAAAVVRALSDPDPDVRAIAIESLPDTGGAEAVEALISSLSDPDDRVRRAAARRLASRGDDPELVWSAIRMAPPTGRSEIIGSFERARPGSLTQVALRRLRSPEEDERVLAVEISGWGASPGCVEAAIQALQDPAARVRHVAAEALGRLREPAAAKALGKALGDPDPEVRMGVVRALGVIDDEGVLGFQVSALNDPDPRVRQVTSQVLTEWSSPAVAKRLAGVLAVPNLREAATDLLTRIGPPAVELLIEVLLQHNPAVAPVVGQLLQRIAEPSEFVARLEAVEPERRLRGVEALGAIGGPEAAEALLRSVTDPDERIRVRSAQLLADLGDPRARDVLIALARDPVPGVVAAAQEALGRLGDAA
jgi:HEAT repeat protein